MCVLVTQGPGVPEIVSSIPQTMLTRLLKVLFYIRVEVFNEHVSLTYNQPEFKYMVPISC